MRPHKRNPWVTEWFCRHARTSLRRNFRKISFTSSSVMPEFTRNVPTIAILNHPSWWDALLTMYLSRFVFNRIFHGVFADEQLQRYGIFQLAGCYSVERDSPKDTRAFLNYTRDLMSGQDRVLWIFPQGEFHSTDQPVVLKRGFAQVIAHLPKVQLMKIAVSYDFWIEPKPEIVIDIQPLQNIEPKKNKEFIASLTTQASNDLQEGLNRVNDIVRKRDTSKLVTHYVFDHGTHPIYDFYRRIKAGITGKRFQKSHGDN